MSLFSILPSAIVYQDQLSPRVKMKPVKYTRVDIEDDTVPVKSKANRQTMVVRILLSTTILFAGLSIVLVVELWRFHSNSYKYGFLTELGPAREIVQVKETVFMGGLVYDDNDNLHRETLPGQPQYVGTPSPEVDAAWNQLLSPLGMVLKGDDASSVAGTTYQESDGSWLVT
ncbi:hypothetical protein VM1G_04721 [Cytospora mali]|uniref:Uncharacterized protein n=1 Tax=Cytospora mali TaxID=578113 RepID=A0A194VZ80_CYTMA|nr:hypothetical protein VM1G_04721 [Valsa mali]